jgi:tyrosyl-tRNA synthetase
VERAAGVLFGGPLDDVDPATFDLLSTEVPTTQVSRNEVVGADAVEWFVRAGLAKSKGEVRKNLAGHYVNAVGLAGRPDGPLTEQDLLHGRFVVLRRGKTSYHLLCVI